MCRTSKCTYNCIYIASGMVPTLPRISKGLQLAGRGLTALGCCRRGTWGGRGLVRKYSFENHEYVSFTEIQMQDYWVSSGKKRSWLPSSLIPGCTSLLVFSLSEILQMETPVSWQLHLEHLCNMDVLMQLPARSPAMLDENWHPEIIQDQPLPYPWLKSSLLLYLSLLCTSHKTHSTKLIFK